MLKIFAVGLALAVAGCASSPSELARSGHTADFTVAENYQAVFRRVSDQARACIESSTFLGGTHAIDAQLYSDLGFGEISYSVPGYTSASYFARAKIAREGDGARVTLAAFGAAGLRQFEGWARGAQECRP